MQALIDQLQGKIKSYKKHIEEAEDIAALNLTKFRQAQSNVSGAQERADVNEQALAKAKARSRASSLAPVSQDIQKYFKNQRRHFICMSITSTVGEIETWLFSSFGWVFRV